MQAPDFAITNPNADLQDVFSSQIEVFGATLVATSSVPEAKLTHAAVVMAEYLDNDEDGFVDDPPVAEAMRNNKALLVMFGNEDEFESHFDKDYPFLDRYWIQDLYATETIVPGRFDATLEEVLHLIQTSGYAHVHRDLSTRSDSELMAATDSARGGKFDVPPQNYPLSSWFHYDDSTCDRDCSAVEYFYWGLTSYLGGQADRCDEIGHEWEPCTAEKLRSTDPTLLEIITRPEHKLPTVLPDGSYKGVGKGPIGNQNPNCVRRMLTSPTFLTTLGAFVSIVLYF